MELGHLLVQGRLMVLQAVSFIHHHVVPLDLVQNGGILQNELICCDDHLHATYPCKLMAESAVPIVCADVVSRDWLKPIRAACWPNLITCK